MTLILLGGVAVYMAACFIKIYRCIHSKTLLRIVDAVCLLVLLCIAGAILYFWRVQTYYTEDVSSYYHVNAYFYPVYQVWCGNSPGVDFHNLYGFYPYLLVPFLHLAGGISDLAFSTVIACMIVLCLFSMYHFIAYITKNRILALLGACVAIYVVSFYPPNYQFTFYLQYTPHRLFFPAISLWVITVLDKRMQSLDLSLVKSWLNPYIIGAYFFTAIALFWNVESGLAVLVGISGYLAYCLAYRFSLPDRRLWKGLFTIILLSVAAPLTAYGIAVLISFIRTGRFLTVSSSLYGLLRFAKDGFYLTPLPLRHPWVLVIGSYAFAAALSMTQLRMFREKDGFHDSVQALRFFLAVLGILVFLYYQGRSDNRVFPFISWPVFLLLAVMEGAPLQTEPADTKAHITQRLSSIIRLILLTVPVVCMVLGIVQGNHSQNLRQAHQATEPVGTVALEVQFIRDTLTPEQIQSLDIISSYDSAVNRELGITDVLPISPTVDWFLYDDVENILHTLSCSEKEYLFWEVNTEGYVSQYCPESYSSVMSRYELYATDPLGFAIYHRIA